ncbi:hypothetical protein P691DRAFT_775829, partial [Macrolepiota fuliginosa MF-IS2]
MSPVPVPASNTEDTLRDAQLTLKYSKDAPGKMEQALDAFGGVVSSATGPSALNTFFEANSSVISAAAASLDSTTIDKAISGFTESVKVVMGGLDALGQVHPFIGVAVVAFKLVVSLDLTRRDNNRKVLAVKVQMQQMMCTLFQLRRIKDPDEAAPDGTILKDRLQPLIVQIARDIEECGSACDAYMKKRTIVKTILSKSYEPRLAGYANKFIDYRDQLDKALTVHIALGVDTANAKLDTQTTTLRTIDNKIDLLMDMFRQLDTPRERETREFVEKSGGPENVIKRTDLLQSLVKKSGDTVGDLANGSFAGKNDIDSVRENLGKELAEDVDAALQQNFKLFHRKMKIQQRQLADTVGKLVTDALSSGTHDKVKDPDLQNLWKEMAWKGSVKARHFVLALRDYYIDRSVMGTPAPEAGENPNTQAPSSMLISRDHLTVPVPPSPPGLTNDLWALEYIDVAHLQTILEAIDDDATGFISIKEANTFAVGRPKGWSLLQWIAFWAQGWEMSLANYKNKIILLLQEMDRLHENVLSVNRKFVDIYLQCRPIAATELVLRSVNTSPEYPHVHQELVSLTEAYMAQEEARLRKNLEDVGYDIDNSATVSLITGPGRIGRYLFPLLYLTLKRHLGVFHYACHHTIDSKEFGHMATTLGSIFGVVEQRIDTVRILCKQAHLDPNARLESLALSMFRDFAASNYSYGPKESVIRVWQDTSKTQSEPAEAKIAEDPETAKPIFSFDPDSQNDYHGTWQNWPSHSFDTNPYTGALAGFWTGCLQLARRRRSTTSTGIQMYIEVDPEDNTLLKGYAVAWLGKFELYGRRRWLKDLGSEVEELDIVITSRRDFFRLLGRFTRENEELIGELSTFPAKEDVKAAYDAHPFGDSILVDGEGDREGAGGEGKTVTGGGNGAVPANDHLEAPTTKFVFRRTPAEVAGFQHILDEGDNKAKARWNFLREAVLLLVRRNLWSWSYFKAWGADRHAFLDYYKRNWLRSTGNFMISNALTRTDRKAWRVLQYRLPPAHIRLCLETLVWSLYRLPFHYGVSCEGCGHRMIEPRFICLTCLDPDMTHSFNLCSQCMDKPAQCGDFTHTINHTMIKARQYVPRYFFAWLINEARSTAIRLKAAFTALAAEEEEEQSGDTQGVGENDAPAGGDSEMLCGCCAKPVDIPCWVCITCVPETYICKDCEEKELPVLVGGPGSPTHCPDHHLLRIHNLAPVRFEREKVDPTVAHINALETNVDKRLGVLESAVRTRIVTMESTVESRITTLESKIRARLEALETLLAQVGPRFNALSNLGLGNDGNILNGSDQAKEVVQTDVSGDPLRV